MRLKSKKNRDKELKQDLKESLYRIRKKKKLRIQSDEIVDKHIDRLAAKVVKSKIKSLDEIYPVKIKKPRRKRGENIVLIPNFILRGTKTKAKRKKKKRRRPLIFVFGSNLAGIHGKGSALKAARKYGAERGIGKGRTGMAYAIPTKDRKLRTLPLERIKRYVNKFFHYAYGHPEFRFKVVAIGCGLAGYDPKQIKPLFKYFRYLKNVKLPEGWKG